MLKQSWKASFKEGVRLGGKPENFALLLTLLPITLSLYEALRQVAYAAASVHNSVGYFTIHLSFTWSTGRFP